MWLKRIADRHQIRVDANNETVECDPGVRIILVVFAIFVAGVLLRLAHLWFSL